MVVNEEHQKYYDAALGLAKEAGAMIFAAYDGDAVGVEHKGLVDLVTDTDKKVEAMLLQRLAALFPTHKFLAEESCEGYAYNLTDAPTWIIDPVDGTTNFVTRQPFFAVSIGLTIGKELVLGVVFNPVRDELFRAVKGGGAFLNDKPISVSKPEILQHAVIATNVGYDRTTEGIDFMMGNIKSLLHENILSLRSNGSSALEICSVACGRFTCFYEFGVHPWDIAAALVILNEAGGVAHDPTGGALLLESRRVLAANNDKIAGLVIAALSKTPVPEKWMAVRH